eukprot:10659783-Ditylum_brightwellii.AAC.1
MHPRPAGLRPALKCAGPSSAAAACGSAAVPVRRNNTATTTTTTTTTTTVTTTTMRVLPTPGPQPYPHLANSVGCSSQPWLCGSHEPAVHIFQRQQQDVAHGNCTPVGLSWLAC